MVLAKMLEESVKRRAREKGREEGRREVREERRKRWDEAYARFGFEVNGVLVLPRTPEVQRFLAGEDEPEPGRIGPQARFPV